jgi:hypothetical protein
VHHCVRRLNPQNAAAISVVVLVALTAGAGAGCRQRMGAPHAAPAGSADRVVDSLLTAGLPERPWSLAGRATFDVEQYRVRGRFRLDVGATGEFALEFSGTTLFGGQREDIVVTMAGDTLRVFDREHARLYEGDAVDELIRQGTGTAGKWAKGVARAAGLSAGDDVVSLERGNDGLAGTLTSGAFLLDLRDGRLTRAVWPDPAQSRTFDDRLEVTYGWRDGRLRELSAILPVRGWRIRLTAVE